MPAVAVKPGMRVVICILPSWSAVSPTAGAAGELDPAVERLRPPGAAAARFDSDERGRAFDDITKTHRVLGKEPGQSDVAGRAVSPSG